MIDVQDETFDKDVIAEDKLVLLDFWAEWCGPCKMIANYLQEVALEFSEVLKVCKMDVDTNVDIPNQYGVRSIPTILFFKNGAVIDIQIGAVPKNQLIDKIKKLIAA